MPSALAQLGAGSLPFEYNDFSGGLNTLNQAFLLQDNQARDLSNVQGTTAGAIVKRNGFATFATPSNVFTSLFPLEATASPFLIGADASALYSVSSGGTVTPIKTGLSNQPWEFVSAPVVSGQGPLFGMNGTDTPQRWSGTGSTAAWTATDAGGTVPNGKYCIYWNNQVFVSGVAANPSRVFWSGIADPTAWNPANLNGSGFEDFDPGDGQPITGIGRVGPYLLVCKPRKLFILVNPATAVTRKLSDSVGCVSHRSIAVGAEGTYFLSEDRGVMLTNGSKLEPLADIIQPTLDSVSPPLRSQAAATYFNAHYYLSVSLGGSTNDTILDYDAKLKSWWKHSVGSAQFAIWHASAGNAQLYSAKPTAAFVDQCFAAGVTQDNGQNFTWSWSGPWQSPTFYRRRRFPTPWFRKRLRQIRFEGAGTVDFSLAKDLTTSPTLVQANIFKFNAAADLFAGTGSFGGVPDGTLFGGNSVISQARLFGQGVAFAFSLVFSATSSTADSLDMYTMMITDRRDGVTA